MVSASIGRPLSILLLMLISLLLRLISLLLLIVYIMVMFIFVVLAFVTHVIVAGFIAVVMYNILGEASVLTVGVLLLVVYGLVVISPGFLELVTLLLVMRARLLTLDFPLSAMISFTILTVVPVSKCWLTRAVDTFIDSRQTRKQVCESHFISFLISYLLLLVEELGGQP